VHVHACFLEDEHLTFDNLSCPANVHFSGSSMNKETGLQGKAKR
jgi:hypothetical protein